MGGAHLERSILWGVSSLEGTDLTGAYLEGHRLSWVPTELDRLGAAHLEGASLRAAHLEGTILSVAHLEGADLTAATFDKTSRLNGATLSDSSFDQVTFDNANLTVIDWSLVDILGDEHTARASKRADGNLKTRETRLEEFRAAVRANRVLAVALEAQGMVDDANRFAYRAQHLQRHVYQLQHRWSRWAGSALLDMLSGYGYQPVRSFLSYGMAVLVFALIYWRLIATGNTQEHLRSWLDPVVLSVTSFHGRAFFAGELHLDDWVARVGALEAILGLLLEVIFIATFTQRFFGAK
jgi:hypothetical protein